MTVHSDSDWRDEFIEAAARHFFVSAYADYVEQLESGDRDPNEEPDTHEYSRATCGADWHDHAPDTTPGNAYALAGALWQAVETANRVSMYVLATRASAADGGDPDESVDAGDFARGLAWMYMGAGPSWFDDHAQFPLEVPYTEIGAYTFDVEAYRAE